MIILVTDFEEFYLAQMKGVIWKIDPEAEILDIKVRNHDIVPGAFIIDKIIDYFPGSIIVGVIDPGVGGSRKNIVIQTEKNYLIGPDNGLFSLVCERHMPLRILEIEEKDISNTFHGRDIFAPLAGKISLKKDLKGKETEKIKNLEIEDPRIEKNYVECTIIYIDNFGNVITNVRKEDVMKLNKIIFMDREIKFLKTYSESEDFLVLIGSHGFLEIAANKKNAAEFFNLKTGDRIRFYYD
jgi:S-adenosylmethionine hydrolase